MVNPAPHTKFRTLPAGATNSRFVFQARLIPAILSATAHTLKKVRSLSYTSTSSEHSRVLSTTVSAEAVEFCPSSEGVTASAGRPMIKSSHIAASAMLDRGQLEKIQLSVAEWNEWRVLDRHARVHLSGADLNAADLAGANLREADLSGVGFTGTNLYRADLFGAQLGGANLRGAYLREAKLHGAYLFGADLSEADLSGSNLNWANLNAADLRRTILNEAHLFGARLRGAVVIESDLRNANLNKADLSGAHLSGSDLRRANLNGSDLSGADLSGADVSEADLRGARLRAANLRGANLSLANLVEADFREADLTGCRIYGTSAWGLKLSEETKQQSLIITPPGEPEVTADDVEVAQFLYLLIHNEKIRKVIDTITSKMVLILGRFSEEHKEILDAMRNALRKKNLLPVIFDFSVPASRDVTETVDVLAGVARFVIADITDATEVRVELNNIIPKFTSLPVQPILLRGEQEFVSLLRLKKFPWVLPSFEYDSLEHLLANLEESVVGPAEAKVLELRGTR